MRIHPSIRSPFIQAHGGPSFGILHVPILRNAEPSKQAPFRVRSAPKNSRILQAKEVLCPSRRCVSAGKEKAAEKEAGGSRLTHARHAAYTSPASPQRASFAKDRRGFCGVAPRLSFNVQRGKVPLPSCETTTQAAWLSPAHAPRSVMVCTSPKPCCCAGPPGQSVRHLLAILHEPWRSAGKVIFRELIYTMLCSSLPTPISFCSPFFLS